MPTNKKPPSQNNDQPKAQNRGRKSSYCDEVVEKILQAIAKTGGDRDGWESGSISSDTFYTWKNKYPEFSEKVAIAKKEYRENAPESQKRQARKAFSDYLYGRNVETWRTEETINGSDGIITKSSIKTVQRATPRWAIERVLGANIDVLEIINILIEMGVADIATVQTINEDLNATKLKIINAIIKKEAEKPTEDIP